MRSVTARRLLVAFAASLGLVTLVVVPGQATLGSKTDPDPKPTAEQTAQTVAASDPVEPSPYPEPEVTGLVERATPVPAPSADLDQQATPHARAGRTPRLGEGRVPPPASFSAAGSGCAAGDTVTLRWNASTGATRYRVQGPGVSTTVTGTSVTFRCPSVPNPVQAAYTIVAQGEAGQSTSTSAVVTVETPAPTQSASSIRASGSPTTSPRASSARSNGLKLSTAAPSTRSPATPSAPVSIKATP